MKGARAGDLAEIEQIHEFVNAFTTRFFGHRQDWLKRGDKELELPSSLVRYYLASQSDPSAVLQPDPPGLSMETYRLAEESTLLYLLGSSSPYRIILVPSAWVWIGPFKRQTGEVLPHIQEDLFSREIDFASVGAAQAEDSNDRGLAMLSHRMRESHNGPDSKPFPEVVLIDNAVDPYVREPGERDKLYRLVRRSLSHPNTKVVLFGGGFSNTTDELHNMKGILGNLLNQYGNQWTSLAVEAKELNATQVLEILTEGGKRSPDERTALSEDDGVLYCKFLRQRLPAYPEILRHFSLIPEWGNLETSLRFAGGKIREEMETILGRAHVFAKGIESLQKDIDADINEFLEEHREE